MSDTFPIFDVLALRRDFPILHQEVNGKPLAFLDSAASSQRPRQVIDCLEDYYRRYHANVHRGVYKLSEEATYAFERARGKVAMFIGAANLREIVFTRNTTEAINLVAHAWGNTYVHEGDHILISLMEHHSNIVPWQMLAQRVGAKLDYIGVDGEGRLVLEDIERLLTERTKIVALTHQSNVLGTINPIKEIAKQVHAVGAKFLVDGAQSVPHMPINVQDLDIDFLAFSGHKMCGPTGVGVLWGKRKILETMPPFLGGGSMIKVVDLDKSTYADIPARFEAGTPAIGEVIALGAAIDFLMNVTLKTIHAHELTLIKYALDRLSNVDGLTIYGPKTMENRSSSISFTLEGAHPHDIASILDGEGIAVRAGHHCTQPLHRQMKVAATTRASFYLYNIPEEVDRLAMGLEKVKKVLRG